MNCIKLLSRISKVRTFSSNFSTQPLQEVTFFNPVLPKFIFYFSQTASASDVFTGKVDALGRAYATGRRKTSVARVWIKEGSGEFVINNKNSIEYFQPIQREHCIGPFVETSTAGLFDIWCTVKGGGVSGLYVACG